MFFLLLFVPTINGLFCKFFKMFKAFEAFSMVLTWSAMQMVWLRPISAVDKARHAHFPEKFLY